MEKLKRRLKAGRRSCRMDLSTRCCWVGSGSGSGRTEGSGDAAAALESEEGSTGSLGSTKKKKRAPKAVKAMDVAELVREDQIIHPKDLLAYLQNPSGKHSILSAKASVVDFMLYTVPTEIFKMTGTFFAAPSLRGGSY